MNTGRVRVRYDRCVALGAGVVVMFVALLGWTGAIGTSAAYADQPHPASTTSLRALALAAPTAAVSGRAANPAPTFGPRLTPAQTKRAVRALARQQAAANMTAPTDAPTPSTGSATTTTKAPDKQSAAGGDNAVSFPALPANSGHGRRAVFSLTDQRTWLVDSDGTVLDSFLGSGSLEKNLVAGTFQVTDRQRHAIGIDDSGTMQFFVVFTHGKNAAIGFHSIPVKDGKPLQTRAQLGTPTSHGCIRLARPDAKEMWQFASLGTTVVVTP